MENDKAIAAASGARSSQAKRDEELGRLIREYAVAGQRLREHISQTVGLSEIRISLEVEC